MSDELSAAAEKLAESKTRLDEWNAEAGEFLATEAG
jgi:hypothetical protein